MKKKLKPKPVFEIITFNAEGVSHSYAVIEGHAESMSYIGSFMGMETPGAVFTVKVVDKNALGLASYWELWHGPELYMTIRRKLLTEEKGEEVENG